MHVNGKTCKNRITWSPPGKPIQLPCRRCIGCRAAKTKEWAVRCVHEAQLYENNSFITLTYADEHMPADGSVNHRHWQLFFKKLRKKFQSQIIRFYMAAEYGEKLGRPHYHALLFNLAFEDRQLWKDQNGTRLYHSPTLTKTWGKGFCSIGEVNLKTAAYVARYIMKKMTGDIAETHYQKIDTLTGEIYQVEPEYNQMSRMPGIGKGWFEKYKSDVYPDDFIIINGQKLSTPNYYFQQLKALEPDFADEIQAHRINTAMAQAENNTPERLAVRQICHEAKFEKYIRPLQ